MHLPALIIVSFKGSTYKNAFFYDKGHFLRPNRLSMYDKSYWNIIPILERMNSMKNKLPPGQFETKCFFVIVKKARIAGRGSVLRKADKARLLWQRRGGPE